MKTKSDKLKNNKINSESQILLLRGMALTAIIAIVVGIVYISKLNVIFPNTILVKSVLVLFAFLPFVYYFYKSFTFSKSSEEYRRYKMYYVGWGIMFIVTTINIILSSQIHY